MARLFPPPVSEVGDRQITVDRSPLVVAVAVLLVIASAVSNLSVIVALVLYPVLIRNAARYRFGLVFQTLLTASVISGIALLLLNPAGGDHSGGVATDVLALGVRAIFVFSVALWARSVIGIRWTAVSYAGATLAIALYDHFPAQDEVTWKYYYSWPLIILILALLDRWRSSLALIAGLAAIILVSSAAAYRSLLALGVVAALLLVLQPRLRRWLVARDGVSLRYVRPILSIAAIAGLVFFAASLIEQISLSGFLGPAAQIKTAEQINNYGSLIAGGRTEIPVALNLMSRNPIGFGPGYLPTSEDYSAGVYSSLYTFNRGYADEYLFGGQIKLHSFWGDLWVNFGLIGLALAVLLGVVVVLSLMHALRGTQPRLLILLMCVWSGWNVLFSPIYSNYLESMLMLALIIPLGVGAAKTSTAHMLRRRQSSFGGFGHIPGQPQVP